MEKVSRRPVASMAGKLPFVAFVLAAGVILGITLGRAGGGEQDMGMPAGDLGKAVPSPPSHPTRALPARPVPSADEEWKQQRETAMAKALRRRQAERQAFIERYAHEQVDARWAARKEAVMLEASRSGQILELGAQPHGLDIDCRNSMCRIQADFANQSNAEDWFTLFSTMLGSEMPNASFQYSRNVDGSARVLAYGLARKDR